ncbi:protein argonaute-2-like [Dermacentor andersoni]|uniref:protein argonaute-2-like n=1 Tax=Dermacentor andersoni TaxID=34620 RepID=UPI0021553919|nr:protein argonaute-2-like [Dermacentor andersoni]XP_054921924.1 protein argonaute-2-like [Dermacentor andersoni]
MAAPNRGETSPPDKNGPARNWGYPQQVPDADDRARQALNPSTNAAVQPQQQHQGQNGPREAVVPPAENSQQRSFRAQQQQHQQPFRAQQQQHQQPFRAQQQQQQHQQPFRAQQQQQQHQQPFRAQQQQQQHQQPFRAQQQQQQHQQPFRAQQQQQQQQHQQPFRAQQQQQQQQHQQPFRAQQQQQQHQQPFRAQQQQQQHQQPFRAQQQQQQQQHQQPFRAQQQQHQQPFRAQQQQQQQPFRAQQQQHQQPFRAQQQQQQHQQQPYRAQQQQQQQHQLPFREQHQLPFREQQQQHHAAFSGSPQVPVTQTSAVKWASGHAIPGNPSILQQQSPSKQMSSSQGWGSNQQSLSEQFSELGLAGSRGTGLYGPKRQTGGRGRGSRGQSQQSRPATGEHVDYHSQAPITSPRGHLVQPTTFAGQGWQVGSNVHPRNAAPRNPATPPASSTQCSSPSSAATGATSSCSTYSSGGASTSRGHCSEPQRWNRPRSAVTWDSANASQVPSPGRSPMPGADTSISSAGGISPSKETKVTTLTVYANHFKVHIPKELAVNHYSVTICNHVEGAEPRELTRMASSDRRLIFMEFARRHLNTEAPIFDGQCAFYSTKPVDDREKTVQVQMANGESRDFRVSIKVTHRINEHCGPGRGTPLVQALEVALRCALSHNREYLGRILVSRVGADTKEWERARRGEALYHGVLTSVRSGESGTFVNVDTLQTVLYKPDPLITVVCRLLRRASISPQEKLLDKNIEFLSEKLKDLKVDVKHLPYRRTGKIEKIVKESADEKMVGSTRETVAEYFSRKYSALRYPKLPCVKILNKDCYYPLEVCFIALGQRGAETLSPVPPETRFTRAESVVAEIERQPRAELGEFVTSISASPVQITAKLLPTVSPLKPPQDSKEMKWVMLSMCDSAKEPIKKLRNGIIKQGKELGMELSHVQVVEKKFPTVEEALEAPEEGAAFIVIVLNNTNSSLYYLIKYYAEIQLGLITQCVALYNKQGKLQNFGSAFCLNVMRKIKAKLGFVDKAMPSKINNFDFEDVMVMGADVSHHGPNDAKPSVAAIVGSIDACASRYAAAISLQQQQQPQQQQQRRLEIIQNMGSMVRGLLDVYRKNNNTAPKAILFYRDGVSEGQYSKVYDTELPCLDDECKKAFPGSTTPKITFLTVQKRHRTRFIRKNSELPNVPAGTVVDTVITHPSQQEFFMCSHTPLRGTARPAHYHVIRDDNEFDPETLQKISFSLCHMYARCDTPVSIPTPVYYAHLAAARASCYMTAHAKIRGTNRFDASVVQLNDNLKDEMFFV